MLEFRDIEITDKKQINAALAQSDFMGCEYSFANNMAWKRLSDSKISFYKDFYICGAFSSDDGVPHFIFPAGKGDYRDVFGELKRFTDSIGKPLILTGVTEKSLALLDELFPDSFTCEFDRDSSDYIYNSSDLIQLRGKKYHAKRNHLARFSEYDYIYSPVSEKDFDDCISFCTMTYNSKDGYNDHSFVAEQYAINTYFTYFNELNLKGGIIRINGQTAAVAIGEKLCSDTFCVHIEKADTRFNGIYAGINQRFAETEASEFKFINREEDLGIDGLRKAKMSYQPAFLLKKHIVTFK